MLELEPLLGALAPPAPAIELENDDARITEITEAVLRGDYLGAAQRIAPLLAAQIYDVRLLGYFLFGVFCERGISVLPQILLVLHKSLTSNLPAFGPERKKTILFDTSLQWFFSSLVRHLKYLEQSGANRSAEWTAESNLLTLQAAAAHCAELVPLCSALVKKPRSVPPLLNLSQMLSSAVQAMSATQKPVDRDLAHTSGVLMAPPAAAPAVAPPAAPAPADPTAPPPDEEKSPSPTSIRIEASAELLLLMKKMRIFAELLERGDALRAAIIADDVQRTIEHFDPRRFLPELFGDFFARLSTHVDTLEAHLGSPDRLAYRALAQLYQVDLDGFAKPR